MSMPDIWSTDMAMSRASRIPEGNTIQSRLDATKIFNHQAPASGSWQLGVVRVKIPGAPVSILASSFDYNAFQFVIRPLGHMNEKEGARIFQAKILLDSRSSES